MRQAPWVPEARAKGVEDLGENPTISWIVSRHHRRRFWESRRRPFPNGLFWSPRGDLLNIAIATISLTNPSTYTTFNSPLTKGFFQKTALREIPPRLSERIPISPECIARARMPALTELFTLVPVPVAKIPMLFRFAM